jgi:single-stranded DNA-binding protein
VNCAYWFGTGITERLKKGTLVELNGRAVLNAYNDAQGEPRASLNLHVNKIQIHSSFKQAEKTEVVVAESPAPVDDLPF